MRRIVTNYLRMLLNFVLGLYLIRLLIGVDEGVYAVIVLLGTSIGISGMMKEIVRAAMVAEVGIALHQRSDDEFRRIYASAFFISLIAACGAAAILACFYAALSSFSIPPELLQAAGVFLLWRTAYTFLAITLAPATNLLPITGRMGEMNFWLTAERAVEVLVAWIIASSALSASPDQALITFSIWSTLGMMAVTLASAVSVVLRDARFVPSLTLIDRRSIATIRSTVGWNGFVVAAMNLYGPFLTIVINLAFGVAATVVFGIAIQLLNYVRTAVMGVAFGLDAQITKQGRDHGGQQKRTIDMLTSMQAMVVLGLCAWIAANIEIVLELWLGDRLTDKDSQIREIALYFNILVFGIVARAVTEGWMKYLSGIGEVRAYGPLLLKGAVFSPVLVLGALLVVPAPFDRLSPAIVFSVLLGVVHLVFLPGIVSRFFGQRAFDALVPLIVPALLTCAALALTAFARMQMSPDAITQLAVSALVFAIILGPYFLRLLFRLDPPNDPKA